MWRITRAYGADLQEVAAVNGLGESARIRVGQRLLIPGPHRIPPSAESPLASAPDEAALLSWPLQGAVQSRFGPRGRRHHDGIDIDGHRGELIRAAADGEVVYSGSRGAYGKTVVIDHGNGLSTLYAHAEELRARRGERVRAGETIARVGRTGNARGHHLHFEVWVEGRPVDPLPRLPLSSARGGAAR